MSNNYLICIVLLLSSTLSFGQKNDHICINFNAQDGINDDLTTGITQDSRGFYWISTVNGLTRYDGNHFKNFYPSDFLGDEVYLNNTKVYFESRPNEIILSLGNSQVFLFDCIAQKLKSVPNFKNRNVADVLRINENKIIISCIDTAFVIDNTFQILQSIVPPTSNKGTAIIIKPFDQDKWLVDNGSELFLFNLSSSKFEKFKHKIEHNELEHSGYNLLHIDTNRKWIYLANYFSGLYKIDFFGNVLFHWTAVDPNKVTLSPNKIIQDPTNNTLLWASGNLGITKINVLTNETENYISDAGNSMSIVGNYCNNLFFDHQKQLWATTNNGLSYFSKVSKEIQLWDIHLKDNDGIIQMLNAKNGDLFVAKYYDEVVRIHSNGPLNSKSETQVESFLPKQLDDSWFIFEDDHHFIHGGKGNLLTYIDKNTHQISTSKILLPYFKNSTVTTLGFKASNGDLWFSANAGGGLVRVVSITNEIQHFSNEKGSFPHSYFTQISEDKNGDLWLCSNKSQILVKWSKQTNTFKEIDFSKILKKINQTVIQCIAPDSFGNIWIGFEGGGLIKYNPKTRQAKIFGKNQGIPSNFIYCITIDAQNRLWLGTKKGLVCLLPDEKSILLFNEANGFPSTKFESTSMYVRAENSIWIGSDKYLLSFNPDNLARIKQPKLAVFIDEFSVNNKFEQYNSKMELALSSNENNITIRFVTLNFSKGSEVVYSYQLQGASESWINIGSNDRINLLNLKYGSYTFKLRAKTLGTNSWVYLSEPIQFTIATPWYKTIWFFCLLIIVFAAIIYFFTRFYYLRRVEIQQAKLEKQKAIQSERDRIAFDMHDDLGSGLTKISYLSQIALSKNESREELEKINKTSLELVHNMSELIWAMKIENDSLQDLLNYLKHYAAEYFETNKIELKIVMPTLQNDVQISGEVRRDILLIVKEGFHNIVKHAHAKNVLFTIKYSSELILTIEDDGVGFDTNKNSKYGNGMNNMKKRAEKLNAFYSCNTTQNGTVLTFEIPIQQL